MRVYFEEVMPRDTIHEGFQKMNMGNRLRSRKKDTTFWAATIPGDLHGFRVHTRSDPLIRAFWDLPHQCHVMERRKIVRIT
jgi:hypothetical protein